jgi:hypothetical protein
MLKEKCSFCHKVFKNKSRKSRHIKRHALSEVFPPELLYEIVKYSGLRIACILHFDELVLWNLERLPYSKWDAERNTSTVTYIIDLVLHNRIRLTKESIPNKYAFEHFYNDYNHFALKAHTPNFYLMMFNRLLTCSLFGYGTLN